MCLYNLIEAIYNRELAQLHYRWSKRQSKRVYQMMKFMYSIAYMEVER